MRDMCARYRVYCCYPRLVYMYTSDKPTGVLISDTSFARSSKGDVRRYVLSLWTRGLSHSGAVIWSFTVGTQQGSRLETEVVAELCWACFRSCYKAGALWECDAVPRPLQRKKERERERDMILPLRPEDLFPTPALKDRIFQFSHVLNIISHVFCSCPDISLVSVAEQGAVCLLKLRGVELLSTAKTVVLMGVSYPVPSTESVQKISGTVTHWRQERTGGVVRQHCRSSNERKSFPFSSPLYTRTGDMHFSNIHDVLPPDHFFPLGCHTHTVAQLSLEVLPNWTSQQPRGTDPAERSVP